MNVKLKINMVHIQQKLILMFFVSKNNFKFCVKFIVFDLFLAPPIIQQKMQDFEISRGQEVTITVTARW